MSRPSAIPMGLKYSPISAEERHKRLMEARAAQPDGEPMWVFGFGSLMWRPEFPYDVKAPAILKGYDRQFRIWSTRGRGSAEQPGLGLCIEDCHGACKGIAFRVPEDDNIDETWDRLWDREMGSGVYKAHWLPVETDSHGTVIALTFVVDRNHPHYTGPLPMDQMAEVMSGACGKYGTCRDYLANTIEEMRKLGVVDDQLVALLAEVDRRIGQV